MRYFNTHTGTPMPDWRIKSEYGINPAAPEARELGFYPLVEAPAGYSPSHFIKEGDTYRAVTLPISDAEIEQVLHARRRRSASYVSPNIYDD